jgi:hypothetical protein
MSIPQHPTSISRLRELFAAFPQSQLWTQIVEPRDRVFARFQPILAPSHIPKLTAQEFLPILYFETNQHWTGLHRQSSRLCEDVSKLRKSLGILLDESRPLKLRLDEVAGSVKGFGKATITGILHIAHPDKYGVWNTTSQGALIELGLYPEFERGQKFGQRYERINSVLTEIATALGTDLWTLDALWWMLLEGDVLPRQQTMQAVAGPQVNTLISAQSFGLERHLHDFLFHNWDLLDISRDWLIYEEAGDDEAGYEYACAGVGRIDLLAKHKARRKWLVIELKRNATSDAVVGQALRYMGWVRKHLADPGDEVHGLIIAREIDDALLYAVSAVPNLTLQTYEVEFRLKPPLLPAPHSV